MKDLDTMPRYRDLNRKIHINDEGAKRLYCAIWKQALKDDIAKYKLSLLSDVLRELLLVKTPKHVTSESDLDISLSGNSKKHIKEMVKRKIADKYEGFEIYIKQKVYSDSMQWGKFNAERKKDSTFERKYNELKKEIISEMREMMQ